MDSPVDKPETLLNNKDAGIGLRRNKAYRLKDSIRLFLQQKDASIGKSATTSNNDGTTEDINAYSKEMGTAMKPIDLVSPSSSTSTRYIPASTEHDTMCTTTTANFSIPVVCPTCSEVVTPWASSQNTTPSDFCA
ncbi:hypothetical protein SEMRO_1397_G269150.1 [Seminavis robusta]|uniref:Uncharacterized protein n=1 Tax=Seminavis robusta TaxID=568900 RepID=A0A9N8EL70_9STRA|nr:hypothetical protein SEMRO_1397_G269150.1 [Seminavis robusta]|eukprot:Sro1397_g269150.1 n/a (135) ;mRNA; r:1138-1542